jgi:hypothetical protein
VSSSSGDEARWYNNSIYLMVTMPYALLATGVLLVYLGHRSANKKKHTEE